MTSNRFYSLHDALVPWDLEMDTVLPWPDGDYFRQVLQAIDAARPHAGMQFVLTDRLTGKLPVHGQDVVVICIRDELARVPSYAHDVRLVAKTYGVRRPPTLDGASWRSPGALIATIVQEAFVQARRAPSLVQSRARAILRRSQPMIIAVPLGTYHLRDLPHVVFDERRYDVSYAGSRINRSREGRRRVRTRKMRSRQELEQTLSAVAIERPEIKLGVHIIESFQDAAEHSGTYSSLMMDSRIALCPRGSSSETYRIFEALRCGTVPVSEPLPSRSFYTDAPIIRLERWSQLTDVLEPVLSDHAALVAMHKACLAWWSEHCSPHAVAQTVLAALERGDAGDAGDAASR